MAILLSRSVAGEIIMADLMLRVPLISLETSSETKRAVSITQALGLPTANLSHPPLFTHLYPRALPRKRLPHPQHPTRTPKHAKSPSSRNHGRERRRRCAPSGKELVVKLPQGTARDHSEHALMLGSRNLPSLWCGKGRWNCQKISSLPQIRLANIWQ